MRSPVYFSNWHSRPIPRMMMYMTMSGIFPRKKFDSLCYKVDRKFLISERMIRLLPAMGVAFLMY